MVNGNDSDDTWKYTYPIWMISVDHAVKKTKGENKANWTENERAFLYPPDSHYFLSQDRVIYQSDCDINLEEAIKLAQIALHNEGYITTANQFECEEYLLCYYDYIYPENHIWLIAFSDMMGKNQTTLQYYAVEVNAHTGNINRIFPI